MREAAMMEAASHVSERAAELRRDFDRSFAEPPRADKAAKEDLLAIRLGAQGFAIRLSEITGLFVDKKVTRVPGASAALLGIAGFRGSIVPVYDLQSLLGHSGGHAPRWLVIAAAAPVAFAFEAFESQLRVSPESITPQQSNAETHRYTQDFVQTENVLRPIIHLYSVLDAIKA
jgi:purine-binding chemotaxis protein CheW